MLVNVVVFTDPGNCSSNCCTSSIVTYFGTSCRFYSWGLTQGFSISTIRSQLLELWLSKSVWFDCISGHIVLLAKSMKLLNYSPVRQDSKTLCINLKFYIGNITLKYFSVFLTNNWIKFPFWIYFLYSVEYFVSSSIF